MAYFDLSKLNLAQANVLNPVRIQLRW